MSARRSWSGRTRHLRPPCAHTPAYCAKRTRPQPPTLARQCRALRRFSRCDDGHAAQTGELVLRACRCVFCRAHGWRRVASWRRHAAGVPDVPGHTYGFYNGDHTPTESALRSSRQTFGTRAAPRLWARHACSCVRVHVSMSAMPCLFAVLWHHTHADATGIKIIENTAARETGEQSE